MGAMVLLMQHTKIVNWAYNAVNVCTCVDCIAPELNVIDRICVCQLVLQVQHVSLMPW